jgi:DNA polymerase epsilon subunit 1
MPHYAPAPSGGADPSGLLRKEISIQPYRRTDNEIFKGFLVEFETTSIWEGGDEHPGLDLYYYTDAGEGVKCFLPHDPYFYVDCEERFKRSDWNFNTLRRRIKEISPDHIKKVELVEVRDSDHENHRFLEAEKMVKITADSPRSIKSAKLSLRDDVLRVDGVLGEWREADIPFDTRVSIDRGNEVKIGRHYKVFVKNGVALKMKEEPVNKFPDLPACAFDLETAKEPMKTPNPTSDPIVTIGAQFDYDHGVVICNGALIHEVPSKYIMGTADVGGKKMLHWEDTALDESAFRESHSDCMVMDPVIVESELEAVILFMDIIAEYNPLVIAAFNGDNFDWPYLAKRLEAHGDNLERFGFKRDHFYGTYSIPGVLNIDVYRYVDPHARLPKGSRGLKAATEKVFHFKPVDWDDPEALMRAMDPNSPGYDPLNVVYYNGSDIYCTMLFLKKITLPYFFSLAMDKPMNMFSISRRGFSSICESGLLQRAKEMRVLSPNRSSGGLKPGSAVEVEGKPYYLISESYKGAVVELNQPGMYRSDWDMSIEIDPNGIDGLIGDVEDALRAEFEEWAEEGAEVIDFEEVVRRVTGDLERIKERAVFRDGAWRYEGDLVIIHADVSSLYPSIIITYKIQPHAIVTEEECKLCPLRESDPPCWYTLPWIRTLTVVDAEERDVTESKKIAAAISSGRGAGELGKKYGINKGENFLGILQKVVAKRRKGGFKEDFEVKMRARICQKAHGLFVDEIKDVRRDRYKYKYRAIDAFEGEKKMKGELAAFMRELRDKYLSGRGDGEMRNEAEAALELANDSERGRRREMLQKIEELGRVGDFNNYVQAGKKAGLNSYYGYLFAPGVKWRSIECPATVTIRGRKVLLSAIDYTSPALELREADTDGYYALMPKVFPSKVEVQVRTESGEDHTRRVNVISALLNLHCLREFTNENNYEPVCCEAPAPAWREGKMICDRCGREVGWENAPQCTLKFDTDGPYHAMFVQARKKYCVWDENGKTMVMKGLELKRNNALPLERKIIEGVFDRYNAEKTKDAEMGYRKAEVFFRRIVRDLRHGEMDLDLLAKTTDVSSKNLKRLEAAMAARDQFRDAGAEDFAFGFDDMQFVRLCLKYKEGQISGYKFTAICNSMGRGKDDPIYNLPVELLQEAVEAYEGSLGINKGAQFMCAFREHDMGADIDEYSSVTFVKSRYPVGRGYDSDAAGNLVIKEVRGGVSESAIPKALLGMEPAIVSEYLKRWTGNEPKVEGGDLGKLIDFDYYIDYLQDLSGRLIEVPALAQGIRISMEDLFDEELANTISLENFAKKEGGRKSVPRFKKPDLAPSDARKRGTVARKKRKKKKGDGGKSLSIGDFLS